MTEFKKNSAMQDIVTGGVAGAADVLSTHPLWTIKTLGQDSFKSKQIFNLVKSNPLILYNGVAANAISMIPITTTRVFLSSGFEKILGDNDTPVFQLLSSGVAGGISSLISAPTELARTVKLKSTVFAQEGKILSFSYSNTTQIIKSIWQTEGITKVFKGYSAIGMRDGIYTAAFVSGAKFAKNALDDVIDNDIIKSLIAYSGVSIFASFINHPFDTIKTSQHIAFSTRWQTGGLYPDHSGFLDTCKKIYIENGVKGFWAGYQARGLRFLIGLIVKATVLEKMEEFWTLSDESCSDAINLVGKDVDDSPDAYTE